ncbi:hypothetical protein M3484_02670 [Pseudomonas sp. GX19020]|uniref:hypothetical protein n=1 Tax=Pseudomonas sp. GX19020 TaxID=2942277 RepID=UPI002018FB04|nr:hypothetical protein [Pseudomonas sp. GX19020]MCL4065478.1 hypothetical protein [Pseudomonas sp. GX19020]
MSEPLTSHEIEDVLSSIRRLVSADLRPAVKPTENAAPADKLLLTPSLRIVETPAAAVSAKAPAAAAVAACMPVTASQEVAAAAVSDPDADESGAPMVVVGDEEILVFFGEAAPLGRSYGGEDYDDAGLSEGGTGLRVVLDSRPALTDEHKPTAADGVLRLEQPIPARVATIPEVDWGQGSEAWDGSLAPETLSPAPQPRRENPDEPLARAWADRAEARIREELTQPEAAPRFTAAAEARPPVVAVSSDDLAQDDGSDADEAWIDEEVLRDLVTEIIRKELAGTLGERITRNVRKLVRLEVNRALSSRDFE